MASNNNNNWLSWLLPNKSVNSISSSIPTMMYIGGGKASRTGEVITPENSLENPTVFACVSFLAQTISQLPWGVSEKGDTGFSRVDHPINKLLETPNAGMNEFEFKHQIVVDLLTYGNCYILKVITSSGRVVELIPLAADQIDPVMSASGRRSYKHKSGKTYTSDEIIHIRDFIGSTVTGLSKVKQCANLVAIDNAIDNTLADHFRNGTAISGVISFQESIPPEIKKNFGDVWGEKFSGQGSSRGSVAVLDGGAEFTQINPISPADADMLNLKQQTMTRIAAVFRVPAYALEISDGSKYDNLSQRQAGFYRDSIAPITKNIQQKLTSSLINEPHAQIEFDHSELVKGDMQTATSVAVAAINANLLTVNEGRDLMGYPEIDEFQNPAPRVNPTTEDPLKEPARQSKPNEDIANE